MNRKATLLANVSNASKTKGGYVCFGYGQVEPNHLSAQYNGKIYAQLPAAASIDQLEQGQFAKYDYAKGQVTLDSKAPGEWMLVYNETKLYREEQSDCEFAMVKDDYNARVYSPADENTGFSAENWANRYLAYNGKTDDLERFPGAQNWVTEHQGNHRPYAPEKVAYGANDIYELHNTDDPFHYEGIYKEKMMPTGTTMVPRLFKTDIGDHFTTNMIKATELAIGDLLTPGADGILAKDGADNGDRVTPKPGIMVWQVVKVYTMPDGQPGVKVLRVQ